MRVAIYVRGSTSRQVKLQTIEQQLERVQKHVRQKEWELLEGNVFRDDTATVARPSSARHWTLCATRYVCGS